MGQSMGVLLFINEEYNTSRATSFFFVFFIVFFYITLMFILDYSTIPTNG